MRNYTENSKGISFDLKAKVKGTSYNSHYTISIMKEAKTGRIIGWLNDVEIPKVEINPSGKSIRISDTIVSSPAGSSLTVKSQVIRLAGDEQSVVGKW